MNQHDVLAQWQQVLQALENKIGKKPKDMNAVLFLIGVNRLGQGTGNFSKEQKQDLLHIGLCEVLCMVGIYNLEYEDEQGWPHYKQLQTVEKMKISEQSIFLKEAIILYFKSIGIV